MKNLLILTGSYPFEELDHFVELDIKSLQKKFNISILPQTLSKSSSPHHRRFLDSLTVYPGEFSATTPPSKDILKSIGYTLFCPRFLFKLFLSFIYELIFLFFTDKEQSLMFTIIRKFIKRPRPKRPLRVRLTTLMRTTGFLFYANYKLRSFDFKKYDLIYSYWGHELALAISFISNKKMVCRLHGYDLYKERRKDMYFAHRNFFFFKLKRIFCISYFGKRYLHHNFPLLRRYKVDVSYIGSSKPVFKITLPEKKESLTILTCSRIHPIKKLHLVAKAIQSINFKLTWHHLGSGLATEESKLNCYIKKLESKKNIKVHLHGHIQTSEVLNKMKSLKPDFFINSSSSEGLPISILEAMSIGVPVAAPNVGGISEATITGRTGYLMPERLTSNRLRETIEVHYASSNDERTALSLNSKKLWKELFDSDENSLEFTRKLTTL